MGTRSNHSKLDYYWRGIVNQNQFGYQGKHATGENELYTWTNCHRSIDWTSKGVQRCICMDIQRPERYSTKDCSTLDWTRYHSTTYSSSKVSVES